MSTDSGRIDYDVVSLALLESPNLVALKARVYERLAAFQCARSAHLEDFARGKVSNWESHGHSRTYVVITPADDGLDVAAFFTIGMASLDLTAASTGTRSRLMGNIPMDVTGAFCIAELARSDSYSNSQLPGSILLDEAKAVVKRARDIIGGRFLVVDAQEVVFTRLYEPAGFKRVSVAAAPRGMEDRDFVTACAVIKSW